MPCEVRCKYCNGQTVVKNGKRNGRTQRYLCRDCNRTFSSVLMADEDKRRKSIYVKELFFTCIENGDSLRSAAKTCGISNSTACAWRREEQKKK